MLRRADLRLIVITDAVLASPRGIFDVVEQSLQAGARAVQLRDKHASARDLLDQAERMRELTTRFNALLFVNDRLDVAIAARADGVHLGTDDLPLPAARAAMPAEFLIGCSIDDVDAARAAERAGASYIGCGAVFGTTSKDVGSEAIGVDQLRRVAGSVRIPVVGIGGITTSNVGAVAATGAAGAAVIGAVMKAPDIKDAVRALLDPFPT